MDRGSVHVKELCYSRSIGASNLIQIALKMAKIREGYFLACTVHVYRDQPVGHIAVKGLMICIFDNDLAQVTQEIGIVASFWSLPALV